MMKNAASKADFFAQLDSGQLLSQLMDRIPGLSFFIKDRNGRFMAINQRGCEYCGVPSEAEALGRTDYDFFPKSRADEYVADDQAILKHGQPIIDRIESAPETAGSPRLVLTTKLPLRARDGKLIGVAGFSRAVEQTQSPNDSISGFSAVIERIHREFNHDLKSGDLATLSGLSVSQFERKFRELFGLSVRKYLTRVRIENSVEMLLQTDSPITEIALSCGFYDHAHFTRSFKAQMNSTPGAYRKRHQRPIS
ncbi:MAG: AraC family transcriptional regulator [Planctomycetota bacterium]